MEQTTHSLGFVGLLMNNKKPATAEEIEKYNKHMKEVRETADNFFKDKNQDSNPTILALNSSTE